MRMMTPQIKFHAGFTLIELMISLAIGLFLMAGVFTVFVNSRNSQEVIQDQVNLTDDARFALETISFDLRHAGVYGRTNEADNVDVADVINNVAGDCSAGWAMNITNGIYGYNDAVNDADFSMATCAPNYSNGDIIEVRYTLGSAVAALQNNMVYTKSNVSSSKFFIGNVEPSEALVPGGQVYQYVARAYYISSFTDAGDGIPSLHRVSVGPGPSIQDEMLLSGVIDMQIHVGLDPDNDGTVNTYANPGPAAVVNWGQVRSVSIWIVLRSNKLEPALDTSANFTIAGVPVAYPNDGYRKIMMSSVVKLRNTKVRSE